VTYEKIRAHLSDEEDRSRALAASSLTDSEPLQPFHLLRRQRRAKNRPPP